MTLLTVNQVHYVQKGDETKPITDFTTFTYTVEFMTAGLYDKVLGNSGQVSSPTTHGEDSKLIKGIRELIPSLYVGSEVLIELPPSKVYGSRPNPFYPTGHNAKLHITVLSAV